LATSFQSKVTGNVTVAPLAGATSDGAAGVGVDALTFSVALRLTPSVPVIVADVDDDTVAVVTVNVRLVDPAETVTLAGTVAAAVLLLDSATTAPPDGAAADSVTVPCDVAPPVTLDGDNDTDARVGVLPPPPAVTVSTALQVVLSSAEILAWVVVETLVVPTLNVVLVSPAGMITLGGTVAGLMPDNRTEAPVDGAGALMVTVAVDEAPAATVLGFNASDVTHKLVGVEGLIVNAAFAVDDP
jgi:hypothetical protein